ncbi:hypothetical protein BABINDRAFT_54960 [Babjeviella inositovora NRRL Y-12698]|uniref:Zn(2)-C6 fungal-type domain-containing protein n=1 Tax=Babjeviella inositovora NRRL Y-12698 TaxID=984486 RepID=A0A1E3QHZ0_9ASCO|nr:uncharacterized protein BABINDRAFT_54960 [Babjeviella inositovora NRRL Y-12698]ODQ77218.1 hypothetical protein BABINDRAFT_54960 [Babjeviella inositovora NRRL Y-12698]
MPPRKRSFSGCWTCRARKIKCGLEKPVCVRCVRANLTCAGYGIKLRWAKPLAICEDTNALINATDGVDEESSQRRNVEFVVFPPDQVYRMFSEVDEVLAATTDVVWTDVPSRSDGTKWYRAGPFGVLNMNPLKRRNDEFDSDSDGNIEDESNKSSAWIHRDVVASAELTVKAMMGLNYEFNPATSDPQVYFIEKLFPNYYRAIPLHRTFFTDPAHDEQQLHLKASYSMAIGPVFRRLVNFFTTSADLFMVLTFLGNIWESYVLPLVHQIIGETLTFDSLVATEDMLLKHCLLNQVLCISSLAYLKVPSVEISADERDFYLRLSIRLRNLAYKQLSLIVDEPTKIAAGSWGPERDAPYKEMLLLALMLQIRLDNLFGIFDNFNRYFERPAKPLSKPFRSVLDRSKPYTLPDVSKVTHSSYTPSIAVSFTHTSSDADSDSDSDSGYPQVIISLDQSHSSTLKTIITVIRDTAKPQLVEIPAEYGKIPPTVDGEPAVNLMYGIPASLMVLLSRITNVANHRYTFDRRRVFPRNFPKICADMEDELFNWKLNWRLYDLVYDPKTDQREKKFILGFHKAIYHNIVSFYHGLVVFFLRLIKDTPPRLLQDHVMACLDNMEMLRELESETCHLQPLFWQYFICGCDATDPEIQDRYSLWFKNYDMLTNHWRAKQVMFEVWQRRGEGDENICWIDIVKDWNWVLFFG